MAALPIHPQYEVPDLPGGSMPNLVPPERNDGGEEFVVCDEVDRAVYAIVSLRAVLLADERICIPQEDFSELIQAIALYVKTGIYPHL